MMSKIKNYLGLCRNANYLIIGADNLKEYKKRLYLIVVSDNESKNIIKVAKNTSEKYNNLPIIIPNENLGEMLSIDNCKIVGIKNWGLANAILGCIDDYKKY